MTKSRDDWWKGQLRRLLALEERGHDPKRLAPRYLLLASRTWGDRRWTVSFNVPNEVYHVLDDPDIRAKDKLYAERQRQRAWEWLNG